jgi:hypothetical protein
MNNEPTTTLEALKLSTIYQQLLNSLESEIDAPQGRFSTRTHQQQIQLVSDAVSQALQLLSARCSRCDEDCLPLCPACIVAAQQAATKLSVEEDHSESW